MKRVSGGVCVNKSTMSVATGSDKRHAHCRFAGTYYEPVRFKHTPEGTHNITFAYTAQTKPTHLLGARARFVYDPCNIDMYRIECYVSHSPYKACSQTDVRWFDIYVCAHVGDVGALSKHTEHVHVIMHNIG